MTWKRPLLWASRGLKGGKDKVTVEVEAADEGANVRWCVHYKFVGCVSLYIPANHKSSKDVEVLVQQFFLTCFFCPNRPLANELYLTKHQANELYLQDLFGSQIVIIIGQVFESPGFTLHLFFQHHRTHRTSTKFHAQMRMPRRWFCCLCPLTRVVLDERIEFFWLVSKQTSSIKSHHFEHVCFSVLLFVWFAVDIFKSFLLSLDLIKT